jgi:hypothetical protein
MKRDTQLQARGGERAPNGRGKLAEVRDQQDKCKEGEEEGGWNNLVRVLPGGSLHEIYGEFAGLVVDGYPIVSAMGNGS